MEISVVIASGRAEIQDCLKSLLDQRCDRPYEIIVVYDSANKPAAKLSGIKYIECETTNPAVKRNVGALNARGEILAFIDDDAVAPDDWLAKGLDILSKHPRAAGCGGPNLPPENQTEKEKVTDAVLGSKIGGGFGSYGIGGDVHEAKIGEIHLVNFFVKRAVFEAAGGFNETLGYGAEDSEFIYLCKRMSSASFIYVPDLWVAHRRRSFGMEFFSQRFHLRSQNGCLLWIRPGMYVSKKVGLFLGAMFLILWIVSVFPIVLPVLVFVYLCFLIYSSASVKGVGKIKWIGAVIALHAVSAAGLLSGWILPPNKKTYCALLRRPH